MSIHDIDVQVVRHRGSKGGGSVDMEAQKPLLSEGAYCPTGEFDQLLFSEPIRIKPVELIRTESDSMETPAPRRLVVMFDGTSNMRNSLTNVSRFFEAIDDSRLTDYKVVKDDETIVKKIDGSKEGSKKHCYMCLREKDPINKEWAPIKGPDGDCPVCNEPGMKRAQLVHYVRGVGSKWLYDGIGSLSFGTGLSHNVKDGYKWLVETYRDGDEIFVYGFSRGAFSARSLVSLLHRCGGLPVSETPLKEKLAPAKTDKIVDDAYAMYQAFDPKHPSNQVYLEKGKVLYKGLKEDSKRMQRVTVAMLGVWDTVGAVGLRSIPFLDILYYHLSSRHYEFHDQDLPCIVEHAYHALAIDEQRFHFAPTLWTMPRLKPDLTSKTDEVPSSTSKLESVTNPEQMLKSESDKQIPLKEVKQVWFMGSHCNVGGGADLDDEFDPDDLWLYSYVWMQKHAEKLGLRFYWTYETPAKETRGSFISHRQPESSYKKFLRGWYQYLHLPFYRDVTASIHSGAAKVHWSVVERIKVDGVELDKHNLRKAAKAAKRKTETCIVRLKNTLCFWRKPKEEEEEKVENFVPYRPESLFKSVRPWTPREWICSKLTLLLCTLGLSKPVRQDDSKLDVATDGEITGTSKWKWPWVEFDDLKSVADLELKAASRVPDPNAKLTSCNCHSELKTEFDVEDTRWLLRKLWDCWVNWWWL
ncbi:hypothetical protein KC19_5G134600 [Ceratodon purpureus]|uniref:T6SS Phospholipase effector Tle1-like catalytic domain-containing protein n=1 Tax=Ceratodon purpureus TaxID=3225 RepID=A0A8T0I293_CERPU|nr:hypothetical protein KC19_5G134600 [Ceratodon purpureus]